MDSSSPLRPRFGGVVFNGGPPRAEYLHCDAIELLQQSGIRFDLDDRFNGEIRVDWSEAGGLPSEQEANVLNLSLAGMMAQHALPKRVQAPALPPSTSLPLYVDILRMLYDIRTFCDETDARPVPTLAGPDLEAPRGERGRSNRKRVLVLLSGGFDSTFALILLREAGYHVEALHIRTNRHVEDSEERAAKTIADLLAVPIRSVRLSAPDQEAIGRYYSRTFGIYPFYNSIPHGRDFPLAVIGAIMARRLDCGAIVFGHEKESRRKVVTSEGRTIYRHDVESDYGTDLVRSFIRQTVAPNLEMFSPVAGLSLYLIRATMLRRYPELCKHVQFCFWGRRCEKCLKCLSTYTMQRHLGIAPIPFDQNPFADLDDQDMALLAKPDRPSEALGYGPQMHYAMLRIILDRRDQPDDYWLRVFRDSGFQQIQETTALLESICLNVERPDEVPDPISSVIARWGLM